MKSSVFTVILAICLLTAAAILLSSGRPRTGLLLLVIASVLLIRAHKKGVGPPPMAKRILNLVQKSPRCAPHNLSGAEAFKIGEMYHYGRMHIPRDDRKAEQHYQIAVEKQYYKAYVNLGLMAYEQNQALPAIEYLMLAIEKRETVALLHLARIYEFGVHPTHSSNRVMAAEIYAVAQSASDVETQHEATVRLNALRASPREDEYSEHSVPLPTDTIHRLRNVYSTFGASFFASMHNQYTAGPRRRNTQTLGRVAAINLPPLVDNWPTNGEIDDAILAQYVFVQPDQQIANNSQNVHSSTLQGAAAGSLNRIEQVSGPKPLDEQATVVRQVAEYIDSSDLTKTQKDNARRVLSSLNDSEHSRYGRSEKEALALVWDRIHQPVNDNTREDMKKILAQQLESGVEYGSTVCSSGKIARIVSSLEAVDQEDIVHLKPEWALTEEIANSTAMVRQAKYAGLNEQEKAAFDTIEPTPDQQVIAEQIQGEMVRELHDKCQKDYVDSGMLSSDALAVKLTPYTAALQE